MSKIGSEEWVREAFARRNQEDLLRGFEAIFGEPQSAREKAQIALRACSVNDLKWHHLVARLSERTGMNAGLVHDHIRALADGRIS